MATVLIVDDEPDILLMLRMSLEDEGHDVVLAADGKMALERIAERRPDIVLLDLMMPVLDGWGVLNALKGRPDSPPVIVVSASDSAANVERARELGVAAYVTKPFNLPALVQLVGTVAQRRSPDRGAAHPAG
jgi:CheY-like chemotaxis protein